MSNDLHEPAAGLTGIVLAGGAARRLGGVDKGWYPVGGRPLITHTLAAIDDSCDRIVISANRTLDRYRGLGWPVVRDDQAGYAGPLAGIAAALAVTRTALALVVPVDTPNLPRDLAARLHAALEPGDDLVFAESPRGPQPLHCLLRTRVRTHLIDRLAAGERRVMGWQAGLRTRAVAWPSDTPFHNCNCVDDARRLQNDLVAGFHNG